jgi:subfamily B ATP-binding cassette protein MsbA
VKELQRLLQYARPYRGRLTIALLAMIVYATGSAYQVYLFKPIFDKVLKPDVFEHLGQFAGLVLLAYFLKGIGAYSSDYLMADVSQRVVMDLRTNLFRHILNQSAAFFSRNSTGQLMSRITNDVNQVQFVISETLADLVRELLAVIGFAGLLLYYDWRLAMIVLVTAPVVVYPLVRLGQRVRRTTHRGQEELEYVTHLAAEGLTGHRIVKAFGAEAREASRFERASYRLYRTNMRIRSALSSLPPLMEFIGGMAAVGVLSYGAQRIRAGMTVGEFAVFLGAAFMLYTPIKKLSRVNAALQQSSAAAERIFALLDTHSEVRDLPGAPPLDRLRRTVEFKDVGFAYEDEREKFILRHVSFTAEAGQVIALVGLSGAGKTTLVNLIPRFYDVTEGAILVDGINVRDASLKSLRDQIALVTQDTVLFDDTISANIAYGVPGASRAQIEAAARAAHAHEFIIGMQDTYETQIGERGQRLSGGQRQRLAIARALLKDCPLLVLDEATSSLDAESERLVQEALANLMRNRTTFVIAHRLSTVRRANLIIALEKGQVAEIGTHEQLVDKPGGVYAKLYALQAFTERRREPRTGSSDYRREAQG